MGYANKENPWSLGQLNKQKAKRLHTVFFGGKL